MSMVGRVDIRKRVVERPRNFKKFPKEMEQHTYLYEEAFLGATFTYDPEHQQPLPPGLGLMPARHRRPT